MDRLKADLDFVAGAAMKAAEDVAKKQTTVDETMGTVLGIQAAEAAACAVEETERRLQAEERAAQAEERGAGGVAYPCRGGGRRRRGP